VVGSARWWYRWLPRLLIAPGRRAAALRYDLELALHDGVATGLSALAVDLDLLAMSTKDPALGARIHKTRGALFQVVDDLRRLTGTIYPPVLRGAGLGPALQAVAERRDLRLWLDLPRHDLCEDARTRTGLLVADHLHTLSPRTAVRVRVRGRRLVRVLITESSPGRSQRRQRRAVLRCA
jgi:signal transduction histidine kinase